MRFHHFQGCHACAITLALGLLLQASTLHAIEPIDCETTPFGNTNLMLGDAEFMSLLSSGDGSFRPFGEYRLPFEDESDPLNAVYSSDLVPAGLPAGSYFLDAINVDLDGDGRDEIAVAYGAPPALGNIVIGIFDRTPGFQPSARLIDHWSLDLNAEGTGMATLSVELAAGDFSGTSTREQQLALKWRSLQGPDDGKGNVIVLTGTDSGTLAQTDNSWAGRWKSSGTHGESSLTHADVLLDGREQIILVAATATHLYTHLLEFIAATAKANFCSSCVIKILLRQMLRCCLNRPALFC